MELNFLHILTSPLFLRTQVWTWISIDVFLSLKKTSSFEVKPCRFSMQISKNPFEGSTSPWNNTTPYLSDCETSWRWPVALKHESLVVNERPTAIAPLFHMHWWPHWRPSVPQCWARQQKKRLMFTYTILYWMAEGLVRRKCKSWICMLNINMYVHTQIKNEYPSNILLYTNTYIYIYINIYICTCIFINLVNSSFCCMQNVHSQKTCWQITKLRSK